MNKDVVGGVRRSAIFSTGLIAATLSSIAFGQQDGSGLDFSGDELKALPTDGWITHGGNIYNQRYSPLTDITPDNIGELKGVWRARLDGSGDGTKYSGEAAPIVHEGVIYVVTGANDVFAISVDSGEHLWKHEANLDQSISTICCGWTSRGVGIGEGKIFSGQLDGQLVALNQATGEVEWSVQAERWQEGYTITSAPLYYDGMVITGFAGAEYATRGRVKAYDAADGSHLWTFYTVPGPGEFGHDTWSQDNEVWRFGGATVWTTPAVDPDLDLVYFSTGNPGPDFNGSVRPGDNLFSASIVAVDAHSGEYRWHFQQVHHDLWDYDAPNPVVLFDIEIDGVMRKAAAEASKTGWVYILDRETGEPLIGIEERPVPQEPRQHTAATQPYPIGDAFVPQSIEIQPEGYPPMENNGEIFTAFWTEGAVAKPAAVGGANWPPSAYDPELGHLFVCAPDRVGFFRGGEVDDEVPERTGVRYIGGQFGMVRGEDVGILAAMDMRTNTIVWREHWPLESCFSGITATASGLLFVGRNDGRLQAFDSSNGNTLWEFQTGAGMNSPVSIFEHNGEQYVVAYSAGNRFAGSVRGDSVWLFSTSGTLDEVPEGGAAAPRVPRVEGDIPNEETTQETTH